MRPEFGADQTTSSTCDAVFRRAVRGDSDAWEAIVARYSRLVYSIPFRMGLTAESCDDVLQESFLALAENVHRIRDDAALPKWLMTTTYRIASRIERHTVGLASIDLGETQESTDDPPMHICINWERHRIVREGLNRLGDPCAALLRELYDTRESTSYHIVADRLGVPVGSIGPRRARCLERLLPILESLGLDLEDRS